MPFGLAEVQTQVQIPGYPLHTESMEGEYEAHKAPSIFWGNTIIFHFSTVRLHCTIRSFTSLAVKSL